MKIGTALQSSRLPLTSRQHSLTWFWLSLPAGGNSIISLDQARHWQRSEGCQYPRSSKLPSNTGAFVPAPRHAEVHCIAVEKICYLMQKASGCNSTPPKHSFCRCSAVYQPQPWWSRSQTQPSPWEASLQGWRPACGCKPSAGEVFMQRLQMGCRTSPGFCHLLCWDYLATSYVSASMSVHAIKNSPRDYSTRGIPSACAISRCGILLHVVKN